MVTVGQLVLTSLASLLIGGVVALLGVRWLIGSIKSLNVYYLSAMWQQSRRAWAAIAAERPELDFLQTCPCCGRGDYELVGTPVVAAVKPPDPPAAGSSAA